MRLNLGCGRNPLPGWTNVDHAPGPGVDLVANLECTRSLPLHSDSVGEVYGRHFLEHIARPLRLMEELWRVCQDGAMATFIVPYGSSDDADEDPTHVRRYFEGSWGYFSQPYYWRADYGYRGDWQPELVTLATMHPDVTREDIARSRNVVGEMTCTLRCVKPARPPERALQVAPRIELR